MERADSPINECPRCNGVLPRVIYGYPNWEALRKLDRQSESFVLGGCIPNLPMARSCPRCGWIANQ